MIFAFLELSKYIMLLILLAYIGFSIWPIATKRGDKNTGIYIRQLIYIVLIHTIGMLSLYFEFNEGKYLILYFMELLVCFFTNRLFVNLYKKVSKMTLNNMYLFLVIGFIMLARLDFDKAKRQFIITVISLAFMLIIPKLIKKFKFLPNIAAVYFIVSFTLLFLVLGLGRTINGSKLCFSVFGLSFQSSEFVKIIFVFMLAAMLKEKIEFLNVLSTAILSGILILSLVICKDLGSALIYYVCYIVVLYVATGKLIYTILGLIGGAGASIVGYKLFTHVRVRIAVWQDPWSDIDKTGYQLTQSLFGIGTGGFFGMGLGKGRPDTIPFVEEDFIFSAISEELGAIFAIGILVVSLLTFILFIKIALRTHDMFYKLVIVGLSVIYITQVILTVGGGTRFIPLTGVTYPLISNGGSSQLSVIMIFAIIEGISCLARKKLKHQEGQTEILYDFSIDEEIVVMKRRKLCAIILCIVNLIIIVSMSVNIINFLVNDSETAINNSYNNKRQEALASETLRGTIYASDGTILAQSGYDKNDNEVRVYPEGSLYAHYVGFSTYGNMGIEQMMNIDLFKSDIPINNKIANDMAGVKNPGNCVYATVEPALQKAAYDAIGVYNGAVIVTEVKTGRVLAMVSNPSFDPNSVSENWAYFTSENNDKAELLNRATSGLYPPGSTFKIISLLEYIRENPDNYNDYSYTCNGHYTHGDDSIACYHGTVHGKLNLTDSLAKSCNSSFANIGMGLDRDSFAKTLLELKFNKELGLSFEHKPSHISMRNDMSDSDVMQTSIGQGETLMTPLHLNMITCAIANDGIMNIPYFVDRVESADGRVLKQYNPTSIGKVMTDEEADVITDMMVQVVENGTAKKLKGQDYTVAGKTGSAEFSNFTSQSHAWFTGFAPAEDPQICVTVILEKRGTGGDYSAPIARSIFTKYFQYH